jgi:hypothetical protein
MLTNIFKRSDKHSSYVTLASSLAILLLLTGAVMGFTALSSTPAKAKLTKEERAWKMITRSREYKSFTDCSRSADIRYCYQCKEAVDIILKEGKL